MFFHPEACILLDKETPQSFRIHVLGDIGRIESGARNIDGVIINVGGEQQHLVFLVDFFHIFRKQDGDGIGLFARGAACHPDAEHIGFRLVLEQLGQHFQL